MMAFKNSFMKSHAEARYKFADRRLPLEGRFLDIGCGDGFGLEILKRGNRQLEGIDRESKFCRDGHIPIKTADITRLVLPRETFAAITMFEALEHIPRETHYPVVHAVSKALARDGTFIITTPNRGVVPYLHPEHISELNMQEFGELMARFFGNVQMFAYGRYTETATKSTLKSIRTFLCKLGVYDAVKSVMPPGLLGFFSTQMRGEPEIIHMSMVRQNQIPLNLLAVARDPLKLV
jgi:SAM-dependent methyltransferase